MEGSAKLSNNRERKNGFILRLNDDELKQVEQKMERLGIKNREAFARKMLLDGYIIQVDTKPYADLVWLVRNIATNINQIAKRANESGSIYENDVLELLAEVNRLNPLVVEAHANAIQLNKQ